MVYGGVFRRIDDEESQYKDEDEEHLPMFGMPIHTYKIMYIRSYV